MVFSLLQVIKLAYSYGEVGLQLHRTSVRAFIKYQKNVT